MAAVGEAEETKLPHFRVDIYNLAMLGICELEDRENALKFQLQ